jgi:hypothetical protein
MIGVGRGVKRRALQAGVAWRAQRIIKKKRLD